MDNGSCRPQASRLGEPSFVGGKFVGGRFYWNSTFRPPLRGSRCSPGRSESLRTPAHVARGLQVLWPQEGRPLRLGLPYGANRGGGAGAPPPPGERGTPRPPGRPPRRVGGGRPPAIGAGRPPLPSLSNAITEGAGGTKIPRRFLLR